MIQILAIDLPVKAFGGGDHAEGRLNLPPVFFHAYRSFGHNDHDLVANGEIDPAFRNEGMPVVPKL